MLSKADSRLAAADPDLPGLALLLDRQAFCCLIKQAGIATNRTDDFKIGYVRYKKGRRCVVTYANTRDTSPRFLTATAHNSESWTKHIATRDHSNSDASLHQFSILSRNLVSIVSFPRDRELRKLEELETAKNTINFVRSFVTKNVNVELLQARCLAYKPGRRAVYRVLADAQRKYVLKFYNRDDFPRAMLCSQAWSREATRFDPAGIIIPKPRRIDEKRRMLVSNWIDGDCLSLRRAKSITTNDDFYRVGKALAQLHGSNPSGLPNLLMKDQLQSIQSLAQDIAMLCPGLADAAANCAAVLVKELDSSNAERRPIHGDFDESQICLSGTRLGILDFDRSGQGNPLQDLGNFIAKLRYNKFLTGEAPSDLDVNFFSPHESALLSGYAKSGSRVDLDGLKYHIAAGLFRCITDPLRHGTDDWHAKMEKLVNLIVNYLSKQGTRRRQSGQEVDWSIPLGGGFPVKNINLEQRILSDQPPDFLVNAMNPNAIGHEIEKLLLHDEPADQQLHVKSVIPLAYKSGRRCVLRYHLQNRPSELLGRNTTVVGKVRFKGVDKHGYQTQKKLYELGFQPSMNRSFVVPKPLGQIDKLRIWFQAFVPGQSLETMVDANDTVQALEVIPGIAEALTDLHRTDLDRDVKVYTLRDEIQSLNQRLQSVIELRPESRVGLYDVISHAESLEGRLSRQPTAGIHRDFYPAQVLIQSKRVCLLDFDLYCRGPLQLDAGNFLAHLDELALRKTHQREIWQNAAERFSTAYQETLEPSQRNSFDLKAWRWLAMARHIWISTRIPERRHLTDELIKLVIDRRLR